MKFGHLNEVREWWIPTMSLSAPLILDPTTRTLRRSDSAYARREWEEIDEARHQRQVDASMVRLARQHLWDAKRAADRRHLADKFLRRMRSQEQLAAFSGRQDVWPNMLTDWDGGSVTQTTLALDSNYVNNTSGDAIGGRLQVFTSKTLQDVYYHITSFTGTSANVNDIDLELRPEASAGAITPHTTTLTEGKTHNPASTTGWNKVTGWTSVLTAAARYYMIVGDADGGVTDFATVLATGGSSWVLPGGRPGPFGAVRTTGGWASGNTASTTGLPPSLVLVFSDSSVEGFPLTAGSTPASDTNRRGLRITSSALTASLSIYGLTWLTANANISGMEIWTGTTGPSGTADHTSTEILYQFGSTGRRGAMISGGAAYTLSAATAYSLVATYSGATTGGPRRYDIGTGEDANLRAAMPGGGNFYFRRANGTTDWSNDLVGSIPDMGVLVDAQVAAASGGGAAILVGGTGLVQ